MSLQFDSDAINLLPLNELEPTSEEIALASQILGKENNRHNSMWKESIIVGILFFMASIPQTDNLLQSLGIPKNPYIIAFVKAMSILIIYMCISWINYFQ